MVDSLRWWLVGGGVGIGACIVVALGVVPASAEEMPERPGWQALLGQYAQDPTQHRRAMVLLGKHDVASLPPVVRLAIADAHLRSNRLTTAARMFDDLLAESTDDWWLGLAAIGRGWVAVRRGRLDEAREFFDAASADPGATGLVGDFMVGMIDAGGGDASAGARFARIVEHPEAPDDLRVAAMMADGYGRFWNGDDAGARAAFERVSARDPDAPEAAAARYGAALAQWRSGDAAGAEATLATLASAPAGQVQERVPGIVSLDPRAMVRASARRYRRLPFRLPSQQALALMHGDTPSVARVALRRLREGQPPPSPLAGSALADTPQSGDTHSTAEPRRAERGARRRLAATATDVREPDVLRNLLLTCAAAIILAWLRFGRSRA